MQTADNTEKLAAFIRRVLDLESQRDDEDPALYLSIAAGDTVRGARSVVTGITVDDKSAAELADEVRGACWRNAGCRMYVVAVGAVGEKSKRESCNLPAEVDADDGGDVRAAGGPVAAMAGQLVRMSRAADERAMFVVQKNGQLMDSLLEVTREKVLLEAREAYADELASMESDRMWAEAFQTFAQTAGQALVPLIAHRMGAPVPDGSDDGDQAKHAEAWSDLDQKVDGFKTWCASHPGLLAQPAGLQRLAQIEAIAKANMAAPVPEVPPVV
jgi:hypothetical protein